MAEENDDLSDLLGPAPAPQSPADEPSLDDILGPSPSRVLQAEARLQNLGPSRLLANPGPGRVPGGKQSAERMRAILKGIEAMPVAAKVCRFNNIHPATLKLWLTKSERGQPGDGFDLVINPEDPPEDQIKSRFHELYDYALEAGIDAVEEVAIQRAIGYEEVLHYQGHVQYRIDPALVELGLTGSETWMKDAKGRPIPETVMKQDTDLIQFILKNRRSKIYGTKMQHDVNVRGGVLVVSAKAKTGEELNAEERSYREQPIDVEFEEVDLNESE